MRSLSQEGCDFPFTSSGITSCSKARKGLSSSYESVIGVEALARATPLISMLKHIIEHGPGNKLANVTSGTALALAATATVISSVATPTKLAAACPPWANSTPSLPSTLLC